jgi:hypothetical protein
MMLHIVEELGKLRGVIRRYQLEPGADRVADIIDPAPIIGEIERALFLLESARIVYERKHMETILIGNVDADLSIEMHFYWNWTQRRRRWRPSWLSLPGPLAACLGHGRDCSTRADAEAMHTKNRAPQGDADAVLYAMICAQGVAVPPRHWSG